MLLSSMASARESIKIESSLPLFEVVPFEFSDGDRFKKKGNYHNPTRQLVICGHALRTTQTKSLTDVSGCDDAKSATSKLTFRVTLDDQAALCSELIGGS